MELKQTNTQKKKAPQRHKKQRATNSHTQESHESTKPESIAYSQRACCRLVQALCVLLYL